ncbi:hypothetical protein Tco_0759732 [Tanacetum coccineum]
MEQTIEQRRLESRTFDVKMNQVLSENERVLAQAIDHDILETVVNLSVNDGCETVNECQKYLELKTELLNKKDFVDKETYDKLYHSANLNKFGDVLVRIGPRTSVKLSLFDHREVMTFNGEVVSKGMVDQEWVINNYGFKKILKSWVINFENSVFNGYEWVSSLLFLLGMVDEEFGF